MFLQYFSRFLFCSLFICLFGNYAFAQIISDSLIHSQHKEIQNDTTRGEWVVSGFLSDQADIWISPFKVKKTDLRLVLPSLSAIVVAFATDYDVRQGSLYIAENNNVVSSAGSFLSTYGNAYGVGALTGIIYLSGQVSGNNRLAETGFMSVEALLQSGLFVYALKMISGRQRPVYDNGADKWHWFPASLGQFNGEPNARYTSFPSGHAAVAFSVASVIAHREKKHKFVPYAAYSIASGIALSRLTEDQHWFSDVLAGSLIGYGVGRMIVKKREGTKWVMFPSSFGNNVVLSAYRSF